MAIVNSKNLSANFIGYNLRESEGTSGTYVSSIRDFLNRFIKNKLSVFGVVLLIVLILSAIIIPFTSKDPYEIPQNPKSHLNIFTEGNFLGTDSKGRDLWARLWLALRYSLGIAGMATIIDLFVGLVFGLMMGYFKRFDKFMMSFIKIISNIPSTLILIMVAIVLKPSFWVVVFALTITGWISMATQIRAQVLRIKNRDWVIASSLLGTPSYKILKSLIPTVIPIIITQLTFTIPGVIIGEASLGFIGLSIPDEPTIGNLINDGKTYIQIFPRFVIVPSALIAMLIISIQFIGNGMQDALRRQR